MYYVKQKIILKLEMGKLDIVQSYFKGKLKLVVNANPKLTKIVTLSANIEITYLKKLKRLADVF